MRAGVASGERSGIRTLVREVQFVLPWRVQAPLLRLLGSRHDPYLDWHRRHRAIFVHMPRTGGKSVSNALGLGTAHFPVARYCAFDPEFFQSAFKFSFVRNPWDRLLSAYSVTRAGEGHEWELGRIWAKRTLGDTRTFEEFVLSLEQRARRREIMRYPLFRPQLDWLRMPGSNTIEVDFIGRFERLQEDFAVVAKSLGIDAALPHINSSPHRDYREEYSTRMRDIVAQAYGGTIRAFDYQF